MTLVHDADVAGLFRCPEGAGPFPGVLALGGSDGGTPEYFVNLLVPDGFACLALQYWGTPATQPALSEVPLERIERGLRWLIGHPQVSAPDGRVGLTGASRGAELALLAAATFPDLAGPVVAYTPSSVVWQGIDFAMPPGVARSSWTYRGAPLPYVPFPVGVAPALSARGMSMLPICEAGLETPQVGAAAIPVERAAGPLLLVSGGDDRVWAAGRMCEAIAGRMARHGRAADVRHLHYPAAGHMLFPYTLPSDTRPSPLPMDVGGTPEADAAAHAAAWPVVVKHLRGSDQDRPRA
jgi:dienelactone hydrolase